LTCTLWLCLGCYGYADDARKDGLYLTVPNPIKADTAELVRRRIDDAMGRQKRSIGTIVFDFNPDELPSGTSNFGVALDFAEFIRRLNLGEPGLPPMTTLAYVRKAVTKHTVLPVIACSQMIFAPDGSIGDIPPEDARKETVRAAYRDQAKYHGSPDLVLRLLDPQLPLKRVRTPQGDRIVSATTIAEWKKQGKDFIVETGDLRGLEPGRVLIDADTARGFGLAQAIHATREQLIEAVGLSRRALAEDWLTDRTWVPWRIEVRGSLDAGKVQSLERRIKNAIAHNANLIILQLDSEAGDIRHVATLAQELRTLKDNAGVHAVRTVAYLPPGKLTGAATFLALGCSEIIFGKDAVLSDFHYLPDADRQLVAEMIMPLATTQGYPARLFEATVTPGMKLVRVKSRGDAHPAMQLVTEAEFKADQGTPLPRWTSFGVLQPGDKLLRITPDLAREWQIASATDVDTLDALYQHLGIDSEQVRVSRDDTLDRIAEFFREPWVEFLLIMFGILGLILEVKLPGTTIPGTIAALCFVLFFWAHSFVGQFTLLAILLFVLGLAMIAVEVFIVPGVAFVGLAGIALVIVSLALVTLDRWPTTSQDLVSLGSTLTTFGLSLVAAVAGAIALAHYLPSIPYANRLVLKPPTEGAESSIHPAVPSRMLGEIGVSVTTLRPAGKAQFGEQFLDVIAEGDYVEPGKRVQIVEIEGYRIVVKEI
jgi:membrane-bound ClpP family serine protease